MKNIIKEGYNKIAALYNDNRTAKKEINYKYFDELSKYFPAKGNFTFMKGTEWQWSSGDKDDSDLTWLL